MKKLFLVIAGAAILSAILILSSCTPGVTRLEPLPCNSRILEVQAGAYFSYYLDIDNRICVVDNTGPSQGGIGVIHPEDCKRLLEKYAR